MNISLKTAAAVILSASTVLAQAEGGYPNGPIKVIVPFPPAGGTDVVTRMAVDRLRVGTGWTFVVDNKAGAGGNIGMDAVAKSKADGYTLGMGQTSNLAINPYLYPRMPYDVAKDFVPVALVAGQPVVLVVNASSRFKTLADLIQAGKQSASLTMASAGNGTVGHLTGEIFGKQAGITFTHIPFKGAGPATTDLLGGQVDFYFATPQSVASFVKTGKLRALAVSSARRMPLLPDVPTVAEGGLKGFETTEWKVLVAPAHTPADIVKRINAEVEKALSKPDAIAQLLAEGSVPMSGSPQQVASYLKAEQQRWGAVVKAVGAKAD